MYLIRINFIIKFQNQENSASNEIKRERRLGTVKSFWRNHPLKKKHTKEMKEVFKMDTLSAVTLSYARQTVRTLSRIWSIEGFAALKCRIWSACHQVRHCEGKGKTSSLFSNNLVFLQQNMFLIYRGNYKLQCTHIIRAEFPTPVWHCFINWPK